MDWRFGRFARPSNAACPSLPPRVFVALALFVLVIAGSAVALGGLHVSVLMVVALSLAACAVATWWSPTPFHVSQAALGVLATAILLTAYTALQCLPLPFAATKFLAPANAEVWARAFHPFHEPAPAWTPLSEDPIATRVEVLKGLCYLLTFLVGLRIAVRARGALLLQMAVCITGCLLALTTAAHVILEAKSVFGVYEPKATTFQYLGPLLNPNHLASYLNIAFCLALSAGLSAERLQLQVSAFAVAGGLAGAQIWVGSRAGVCLLVFAVPLVFVLFWVRRGGRASSNARRAAFPVLALLSVVAMVVVALSSRAVTELGSRDTSKLAVVRDSLKLVPHHAFFGVGRGAFDSAYPEVQTLSNYWEFTNPENIVAQWVTEWGVPVSVAAALLLALALRPRILRSSPRGAAGAWAALAVTFVHNMADFNTEVPGVMVAVTVCAALVMPRPVRDPSSAAPAGRISSRGPRVIALVAWGVTLLVVLWVAPAIGHSVLDDRRALLAAAQSREVSRAAFEAQLHQAIERHPAEQYLPYAGALRKARFQEGNPIAWIAQALERNPHFGKAHLLLATQLVPVAPAQARLEYRVTMEQEPDLTAEAVLLGERVVHDISSAMELVPPEPLMTQVMEALASDLRQRLPATSTLLDRKLLAKNPLDPSPLRRTAEDALSDLEGNSISPWCAGVDCFPAGLAAAERLIQAEPMECSNHILRARFLIARGSKHEALDSLRAAALTATNRTTCLGELAKRAFQAGEYASAEQALDELVHACATNDDCIAAESYAGSLEDGLGRYGLALLHYRKALARSPERQELNAHVQELARRSGILAVPADPAADRARRPFDPGLPPNWALDSGGGQ